MPDHFLRETCRLCLSKNLEKVLSLTPTPPANSFVPLSAGEKQQDCYPLDLYMCKDCTHVQLCDVVDPRLLFEHYVYVSGTSPVYRKHLQDYAQDVIARYAPDRGREIMEIGSNDGTFLKFFQAEGFTVHGVDPAKNIAAMAVADGVPTTADFFLLETAERLKREGHKPQVILANHVFAHIDDLRSVMAGVAALLPEDGVFIFEVSYLLDVIEHLLFDTIYHEHVAYHSVRALRHFLDLYGFELVEVARVAHQGGSLRSFAQRKGGAHKIGPSVAEFLAREQAAGLADPQTYVRYAARLQDLKTTLGDFLRGEKAKGKTIAGFGAPAKATTLMYHFGLGADLVDFIADDNPLKQNTLTPGLHVPVLPAAEIYARKPDIVVILAWNFADSIMAMHQKFLAQGGCFVIPLPAFRVVRNS